MSLIREHHETREEWLQARADSKGIGASECAAIVGLSPWETARDLWMKKTGQKKSKDLSDVETVAKGIRVEPALRELFKANHPEFTVYHEPFDILYQEERPWLFATLDGRIETEDGHLGVLEIKSSTPSGKEGWKKWENQLPSNYFCQLLWQLNATGYDFAILFAGLYGQDGTMTIREYEISKDEVAEDMDWILHEGETFWESVTKKKLPSLTLVI